jgi:predicted XRE-type DNA-binding protein
MESAAIAMETFDSVFDALADTPAEAANMTARADLLLAFASGSRLGKPRGPHAAGSRRAPWADAAPPQRSDALAKLDKFSLDALVNIAAAAGFRLHIELEDVKAA